MHDSIRELLRGLYYNVPLSLRLGLRYYNKLNFINKSQYWDLNKLEEYQNNELEKIIKFSYENIPFYNKFFNENGLKPSHIKNKDDLKYLPIIDKKTINKNYPFFIAKNIRKRLIGRTSGSTGEPFEFQYARSLISYEHAFISRVYDAHKSNYFKRGDGIFLRTFVGSKDEILKFDKRTGNLYLSPFFMSKETIKNYVNIINNSSASFLSGYASSIYILAVLAQHQKLSLDKIKVFHSASEMMPKNWKQLIEKTFNIPVKEHYGMAEKVSLFHQCNKTNLFHENMEYGITEFNLNENGNHEVISTGLLNYVMPLIRYKVGDIASINSSSQKCACGSSLPLTVSSFQGRSNDLIKGQDGMLIPTVNFFSVIYNYPSIKIFQIRQLKNKDIIIYLSLNQGMKINNTQQKKLISDIKKRTGSLINIEIEISDSIEERMKGDKFKIIRSEA